MPPYIKRGLLPPKRHTQFRKTDGSLYAEQLFSTEGFSSDSSLLYHCHPPTAIMQVDEPQHIIFKASPDHQLKHRSFDGFAIHPYHDWLESRRLLFLNSDLQISLAAPQDSLENYFYKNADADELLFVHEGSGSLLTAYGKISFVYGDYLVIPRGTIYQIHFNTDNNRLLVVESFSPIYFPKRYLSKYGQLLEHAPFCERDLQRDSGDEDI